MDLRDVTIGKIWMRPLQWWAESAPPPGGDRVKVSENLGAIFVAPVSPVDTSLDLSRIDLAVRPQNGPT